MALAVPIELLPNSCAIGDNTGIPVSFTVRA